MARILCSWDRLERNTIGIDGDLTRGKDGLGTHIHGGLGMLGGLALTRLDHHGVDDLKITCRVQPLVRDHDTAAYAKLAVFKKTDCRLVRLQRRSGKHGGGRGSRPIARSDQACDTEIS